MQTLTLLLLLPVMGALLIAVMPNRNHWIRNCAIAWSAAALFLSWWMIFSFDTSTAALQFVVSEEWNPRLGTRFELGLDGISFPMVLLTTLLGFIAILASADITKHPRGYYLLMLLLEAATLGVFMAQDWSLFYVFWELVLIPLFFLINHWGGERRQIASLNFVLYTMGGSVFMLISLLVLFDSTPTHSFSVAEMTAAAHSLPAAAQVLIFLGLLIGFGVKMPIFPIHGWLPLAHVEAPSPVSILLSGILLKMGAYGLIRAAAMLPLAVINLQDVLATIALLSLIYGGLLAWRQSDLKSMIAYSSISHMGVVLLGIASLNSAGLTGAVMQMVAHGLVAGALFLLIGLLYERTHSRDINHYSSLMHVTPRFAFFTSLALFAAIGIPGTAGFIAEVHVLIGSFKVWGSWGVVLTLGVMVSAVYSIRTMRRLFTGPAHSNMLQISDLKNHEMLAALVLSLAVIILGIFPSPALAIITASIDRLSLLFIGSGAL